MSTAQAVETENKERTSKVLADLAAAVSNARRLFREKKYNEARDVLRYRHPAKDGAEPIVSYSMEEWLRRYEQEVREVELPVFELRAQIMAVVTENSKAIYGGLHGGTDPLDGFRRAANGDERWDRNKVQEEVNAMVADGTLVYKQKLLWLPARWEDRSAELSRERKAANATRLKQPIQVGGGRHF